MSEITDTDANIIENTQNITELFVDIAKLHHATLAIATADVTLVEDDALDIKEYRTGEAGGGIWDVVSGETPNGNDIVQHDTLPLQLKLRRNNEILKLAQFGFSEGNTAAVNQDIFDLALGGSLNEVSVEFPAGTFPLDPTFIGNFTRLFGAGRNETILQVTIDIGNNSALLMVSQQCELSDFTLENIGTNITDSIGIASWVPNDGNGMSRSTLSNITIDNFGIPIGATETLAGAPTLVRNHVFNTNFYQLFLFRYKTAIQLSGTGMNNCGFYGTWFKDGQADSVPMRLNNATNIRFENTAFETTSSSHDGIFTTCENITFSSTYFEPLQGFTATDTDVHFTGGLFVRAINMVPSTNALLSVNVVSGLLKEPIVSTIGPISTRDTFREAVSLDPTRTIVKIDGSGGNTDLFTGGNYFPGIYTAATNVLGEITAESSSLDVKVQTVKPFLQARTADLPDQSSFLIANLGASGITGFLMISVVSSLGAASKTVTITHAADETISTVTLIAQSGTAPQIYDFFINTSGDLFMKNDHGSQTMTSVVVQVTAMTMANLA